MLRPARSGRSIFSEDSGKLGGSKKEEHRWVVLWMMSNKSARDGNLPYSYQGGWGTCHIHFLHFVARLKMFVQFFGSKATKDYNQEKGFFSQSSYDFVGQGDYRNDHDWRSKSKTLSNKHDLHLYKSTGRFNSASCQTIISPYSSIFFLYIG